MNPHGFTRQILSLVRLPIPPLSHSWLENLSSTQDRYEVPKGEPSDARGTSSGIDRLQPFRVYRQSTRRCNAAWRLLFALEGAETVLAHQGVALGFFQIGLHHFPN